MSPRLEKAFYGIVVAVFISTLVAFIQESDKPFSFEWYLFFVLMLLSLITAIIMLSYQRVRTSNLWRNRLGVVRVFASRNECEELIKKAYEESSTCRIFILRGLSDFVGKDKSLFESLSLEEKSSVLRKKGGSGQVRVLLSSQSSKFISSHRYKLINSKEDLLKDHKRTSAEIRTVAEHLENIKSVINLSYRFYTDAFLCKFYLFDDTGFVTFNERSTRIDQRTPTIQIKRLQVKEKNRENQEYLVSVGLFASLERYFDFLWEFQSNENQAIDEGRSS